MQRLYQPPNPLVMTIAEQRNQVSELLAQVDDEFFSTVYTMLETYVRKQQPEPKEEAIVGYEVDGTAITASAFLKQADDVKLFFTS